MDDNDLIKGLINFSKTFFLKKDFDTYDEFNTLISPLMTDDIDDKYSEATKELERSDPKLLKKYVEHFSCSYDIPLDTAWSLKNFYLIG